MDVQTAMTIINSVGFPIACVLGLGVYIYKKEQNDRTEREKTNEMLTNFALNLQANTNALQNLSELIKERKDKE